MSAPAPASTALLLIDVINDFAFEGSENLLRFALPAAQKIRVLKQQARAAGVPVLYVNDNFGYWQSDFREQIDRCQADGCAGREVVQLLCPDKDDYFVLKPRHSGFFSTSLEVLLGYLGAETLALCGFAGDICVLYTANDAYMREYKLIIAGDGVASETEDGNTAAIDHMKSRLKAEVVDCAALGNRWKALPK